MKIVRALSMFIGIVLSCTPVMADEKYQDLYNNPAAQALLIQEKIKKYFPEPGLAEAFTKLANCESTGLLHWMPDGSLRPQAKKLSSARGVLQILAGLHGPEMKEMGLDIKNLDDYMQFARYLYDTQGPGAWKECVVKLKPITVAMLYKHK